MSVPVTAKLSTEIGAVASPKAGEYHTRDTGVVIGGRAVLFGIDGDQHLHLLLPLAQHSAVREDRRSEGVKLLRNELVEGAQRLLFADLECTKPYLHATFHSLAQEILESLAKTNRSPDDVAIAVLGSWRELLDRLPATPLGRESLAGLFAELTFLERIWNRQDLLLRAWTGPLGQRHDFSKDSIAVEVKASLSSQKSVVRINGLEQLEAPRLGALFLYHVRLEDDSGGRSVPMILDSLCSQGADRKQLMFLLSRLHYYAEHEEQYRLQSFRVLDETPYRVSAGFPRLTVDSFANEQIPDGIEDVSYAVNLQLAAKWRVEPRDWLEALRQLSEDPRAS